MAAVLAEGSGAVLSHRSAAALWGVLGTSRTRIEVTVPRKVGSRPGVQVHRAALSPDEIAITNGIPVTAPCRTLFDLAAVAAPRHLERAINQAEVLRLTDTRSLAEVVARHSRRRGVAALRKILDAGGIGVTITRSELEDRFLAFVDQHGLPRPEVNARLDAGEVDCLWRVPRLVAELDGFATHGTRSAFERDRVRDRALLSDGWRVTRVTWRQLSEQPGPLATQLGALLG